MKKYLILFIVLISVISFLCMNKKEPQIPVVSKVAVHAVAAAAKLLPYKYNTIGERSYLCRKLSCSPKFRAN